MFFLLLFLLGRLTDCSVATTRCRVRPATTATAPTESLASAASAFAVMAMGLPERGLLGVITGSTSTVRMCISSIII